jgi:hypothetical protein
MKKAANNMEHKKITFKLQRDEDGYPPNEWESLWGRQIGQNLYEIDNIPFFVRGVSYHDIVSVEEREGSLHFKQMEQPSGHSVVRVVVFEKDGVDHLRRKLSQYSCGTELSHLPSLVAVDIPPTVSIEHVLQFLADGEKQGRWEYEEASLRHR